MQITREFLEQHNACNPGKKWFDRYTGETEHEPVISALMADNHFDWANWLMVRLLTPKQRMDYAIHAAELVLPVFEAAHPDDDRPRKAIAAAKEYLAYPSEENREAADAAFSAALAAARAAFYAANAAAYAAAHAANAAARAAPGAAHAADAAARAARAAPGAKESIIAYGLDIIHGDADRHRKREEQMETVHEEFTRRHGPNEARITGALCAEVALLRDRLEQARSTLEALVATTLKDRSKGELRW